MNYFYQDMTLGAASLGLLFFLISYMIYQQRFTHGGNLLLALILMLSTTAFSGLVLRWNPNLTLLLLANSINVFCFLFAFTIILHFSLFSFSKSPLLWKSKAYLLLYVPAVILSFVYALSPLMLAGIVQNPFSFQILYAPGYWAIVLAGFAFAGAALLLELFILARGASAAEKRASLLSLLTIVLLFYFYGVDLIRPFFANRSFFPSPLPLTIASFALVYEFIKYHYFSLGKE